MLQFAAQLTVARPARMVSCSVLALLPGVQHAHPEQVELGPAVHLPLEQLKPVDLSFDLPVAPTHRQRRFNRRIIRLAKRRGNEVYEEQRNWPALTRPSLAGFHGSSALLVIGAVRRAMPFP